MRSVGTSQSLTGFLANNPLKKTTALYFNIMHTLKDIPEKMLTQNKSHTSDCTETSLIFYLTVICLDSTTTSAHKILFCL